MNLDQFHKMQEIRSHHEAQALEQYGPLCKLVMKSCKHDTDAFGYVMEAIRAYVITCQSASRADGAILADLNQLDILQEEPETESCEPESFVVVGHKYLSRAGEEYTVLRETSDPKFPFVAENEYGTKQTFKPDGRYMDGKLSLNDLVEDLTDPENTIKEQDND